MNCPASVEQGLSQNNSTLRRYDITAEVMCIRAGGAAILQTEFTLA